MLLLGDCLTTLPTLPAASVQTCITSPPYFGLRDYGVEGQLGLEPTPRERVADGAVRTTRNKRSVWTIPTQPMREAHFATFPESLVEPCIRAGSRPGDTVLDPFLGSGTTALVAEREGRQWIGCELNPEYVAIAERRLRGVQRPLVLEESVA